MKVVDKHTLQMREATEEEKKESMKQYLYVLSLVVCENEESSVNTFLFKEFDRALDVYKEKVTKMRNDMADRAEDLDDIVDDENVNPAEETAWFQIFEDGYYETWYRCITISKEEVR